MYRKTYRDPASAIHRLGLTAASTLALLLAPGAAVSAAQEVDVQPALDLARGSDLLTRLETSDAFLIRPSLHVSYFGADMDLKARLAGFGYDSWSSGFDGRLRLPTLEMEELDLRAIVSLDGEANWYADRSRSGQMIGRGRLEFGDESFSLWAGAGTGGALNSRDWRGLSLVETGASAALGSLDFRLSAESRSVNVTFTGAPGDTLRQPQGNTLQGTAEDGALGFGSFGHQQLRYLDAEFSVGWELGRLRLDATLGARQGNEFVDSDGWAHMQASVPITNRLTAIASGGRLAGRPEQGVRTRDYYMLGLRLKLPGGSAGSEPPAREPEGVSVGEPRPGGLRTLQMRVPGASRVEIMGDFNAWQPQPMTPLGGDIFELRQRLGPGVYRVNIRVDGGPWIVPPGLTGIPDEFDGRVGLLVVRPNA